MVCLARSSRPSVLCVCSQRPARRR